MRSSSSVDTDVLLDLRIPGAAHAARSEASLTLAFRGGALVISEPDYTELAAAVPDRYRLDHFLTDVGIRLVSASSQALHRAGQARRAYRDRRPRSLACPQCGATQHVDCHRCGHSIVARQHVAADFLIGGHALLHADRLLTRDRAFYGTYFPDLVLMT